MKKILIALALCLSALVPAGAGVVGSSAHAEDPTCQPWDTKSKIDAVTVAIPPGAGSDETWSIKSTLSFQKCSGGSRANIGYFQVVLTRTGGAVCSHDRQGAGVHTDWRGNPNVLGNWNPGEKTVDCDTPTTTLFWGAPQTAGVFASDPPNERCIAVHLTAVVRLANDTGKDTESICLFNG